MSEVWKNTVRKADVITVTSDELRKQLEPVRSSGIHYVGNGVEYKHFAEPKQSSRPTDFGTTKPVVCYSGAVYPWLDYELLGYAFDQMPDVHFLFLGPVHPQIQPLVRQLSRGGNSTFLGFRPYASLPDYFQYIEVGIIPFQINDLTRSVNPVKLYEYSAAGKPTVATMFSDDLLPFRDRIFLAHSAQEFVAHIRTALQKSRDPEFVHGLRAFAKEHDWSAKTSVIEKLILTHHTTRNISV
jgi:glycosyltransferase involved in cell wall biosynthesis